MVRICPGKEDGKEAFIPNRTLRWTDCGFKYEADPRQGEKLVAEFWLEGFRRVGTPGVKQTFEMVEKDQPLGVEKHAAFKGIVASGNCLSVGKPETQYASKEICKWMSSPSNLGVQALRRLGRFLETHKRLVFEYPFQSADKVDVYSDTDWSGCVRTRKSTRGGCLMFGNHFIKSWSRERSP